MYAQVEKSKENKSTAAANSVAQKKNNGKRTWPFVNARSRGAWAKLKTDDMVKPLTLQRMAKPYIVDIVPTGRAKRTCNENAENYTVKLETGEGDSYYLKWNDGAYVEADLQLTGDIKYFYTSELSGCSLWYKYNKTTRNLKIRHEARTTQEAQKKHIDDGYSLWVDSNDNKVTMQLSEELTSEGLPKYKTTTNYIAFATITYQDTPTISFTTQLVRRITNNENNTTKYTLLDEKKLLVRDSN